MGPYAGLAIRAYGPRPCGPTGPTAHNYNQLKLVVVPLVSLVLTTRITSGNTCIASGGTTSVPSDNTSNASDFTCNTSIFTCLGEKY